MIESKLPKDRTRIVVPRPIVVGQAILSSSPPRAIQAGCPAFSFTGAFGWPQPNGVNNDPVPASFVGTAGEPWEVNSGDVVWRGSPATFMKCQSAFQITQPGNGLASGVAVSGRFLFTQVDDGTGWFDVDAYGWRFSIESYFSGGETGASWIKVYDANQDLVFSKTTFFGIAQIFFEANAEKLLCRASTTDDWQQIDTASEFCGFSLEQTTALTFEFVIDDLTVSSG